MSVNAYNAEKLSVVLVLAFSCKKGEFTEFTSRVKLEYVLLRHVIS